MRAGAGLWWLSRVPFILIVPTTPIQLLTDQRCNRLVSDRKGQPVPTTHNPLSMGSFSYQAAQIDSGDAVMSVKSCYDTVIFFGWPHASTSLCELKTKICSHFLSRAAHGLGDNMSS